VALLPIVMVRELPEILKSDFFLEPGLGFTTFLILMVRVLLIILQFPTQTHTL